MSAVRAPSVLVVEHEADAPPGWLGEWLEAAGAVLDVRRPYAGEALPGDLTSYAGMLVLGGEMGANDDATCPWLGEVKRLVVSAAQDGTPVLGVCLGHQLAAVALGGEAGRNPLGQQVGVLEVGWLPEAADDALLGPVAGRHAPAVQWNDDVVTRLPEGAVALARTGRGELQAARLAPTVWGVQWHPEVGEEIFSAWAEHDREAAVERGVDLDAHLAAVAGASDGLRATWVRLAEAFARACAPTASEPSRAR